MLSVSVQNRWFQRQVIEIFVPRICVCLRTTPLSKIMCACVNEVR